MDLLSSQHASDETFNVQSFQLQRFKADALSLANTLLWKPQENTALIIKVRYFLLKYFFLPTKITVFLGCYALYFALTDSTAALADIQIGLI